MSTNLHVIKKVEYDNNIMKYCRAWGNPIANNLVSYEAETLQYYMTEDDFEKFKKEVLPEIEALGKTEREFYLEVLDNMEKKVKEDYEIILEAF